ncbi:MAG: polyphenol oxidase family protein, partial [Candidatus Omnitrophica bacterium]|nr:polyphenol oxidase family protein [Candidatus Omnitrophota bacterium]
KAMEAMIREYGTDAADVKVVFGPAIRSCCYEVGKEFVEYFPEALDRREQKLYLDLAKVNRAQLLGVGVLPQHIVDDGQCTCCDLRFFSYRREGEKAGRHLSLMMLK